MIIKTFPWKNEQESKTRLKVDGFWFKRPLNIMIKILKKIINFKEKEHMVITIKYKTDAIKLFHNVQIM